MISTQAGVEGPVPPPLPVLFNSSALRGPFTGIARYVWQLGQALEAGGEVSLQHYCGSGLKGQLPQPNPIAPSFFRIGAHIPGLRTLRQQGDSLLFRLRTRPQSRAGALYHEPRFIALPYHGPQVITVHDLSCFDLPETHPAERVALLARLLPRSLARADRIIAISQATAERLQSLFGVPEARIHVTHLAADPVFHPRDEEALQLPLAQLGLEAGTYLLTVGTLEPRKNLHTLFLAYQQLPAPLRQAFPLVVAGMSGWHQESLLEFASPLVRAGQIRLLGHVPESSLPALYAGARLFAYPSCYEGFGLPPLEAMASGTPVLTSDRTSLPEVVGNAGLTLPPDDVSAWHTALARLLEDAPERARLSQLGLERAAGFSWQRCARETCAAYRAALTRHGQEHSPC